MKFGLKRTVNGTEAEVMFDSLDELVPAFSNLQKMILAIRIGDAQIESLPLWEIVEGFERVVESVEDSGEQIALSLLKRWPNAVRNVDIVTDTGLSRAGIYDYLTGRIGNKGEWFETQNGLYVLSRTGENKVVELVSEISNQEV